MMQELVLPNVWHRPVRTMLSALAVAVEVSLVVLVVGLTSGLITETAKRIEGVGADVMVQAPSSSAWLVFGTAPMPMRIGDKLRELRHVAAVAPVLVQFNSVGGLEIVYGIDAQSFRDVSGGFVLREGRDLQAPDDILVDDVYMETHGTRTGQALKLFEHEFHVVGIVEHGKGARLFVRLETLQELSGARDKASLFFIKCTRAEHTEAVMEEIRGVLKGYEVRPLKDYLSLMTATNLPGLETFITAMIALAMSIGFLVIFLAMYTTIMERTREIGVLKSLGASNGYIAQAVLGESGLICLFGAALGVGMSYGLRPLILLIWPNLTILITVDWMIRATLIALVGGLLGGAYPAWLATRRDPVEALAFE